MATTLPSFDELLQRGIQTFRTTFSCEPTLASCAPGRVNLIGEHIDYNDGFVLPMALPMVTLIVGKPNGTQECDIVTCNVDADAPKRVKFGVINIAPGLPKWVNYVKGVMHNYEFPVVDGFDAVIVSNVPTGGGLSSSAALEMSTLKFLEALTKLSHSTISKKALICQKAEHEFCNVPCGIMDQLISVGGKAENALLIDCQNFETTLIPFKSHDYVILISNSNIKHELSSSEYPIRRNQCTNALKQMGLNSYRDAKPAHLVHVKDEISLKRARHVIGEIKRTMEAAEALKQNNFPFVGKLMQESHKSLSEDFEVSCEEVDKLVSIANACEGVLGSRMTGGGFGGCTVTLVAKGNVESVIETMNKKYRDETGVTADFYICEPCDGARLVNV